MKITLVSPPFGENGQKIKGLPLAPPALEYLAGLTCITAPETEIELIDANISDFDIEDVQADLVGFTVLTPQAPWAYRAGDKLKKRGIPVVMGGAHISILPQEAAPHANALVLGEAEAIWGNLLNDCKQKNLKPIYHGPALPLDKLAFPRTDLLPHKYRFGSFFTSRGCPYSCNFCTVPNLFGNTIRLRHVAEVVKEVASSTRKMFMNTDDNVWGFDIKRSIELFRELALNVRRKYWFGPCSLAALDHPQAEDMLKWARRGGLTSVMVGWESNNQLTLDFFNAQNKQGRSRADALKKIRAAGIDVMLFVMVGSRNDTIRDFENLIKLSDELDVSIRPVMTIPLPGTKLYEAYKPYLISSYDWDSFLGNKAVFTHPTLSPQERERALVNLWEETYHLPQILRRMTKISLKGFPAAYITSFITQFVQAKAFKSFAQVNLPHAYEKSVP